MPLSLSRLQSRIEEISAIGRAGSRGITRLAYTSADLRGRELLSGWLKSLGLKVRVDQVGNIFARRIGRVNKPVVMMGSHLDTVTNGGAYDGTLGVLAALEILEAIREDAVDPILPIELVVFACEESSRFGCSLVGSKYLTGGLTPEKLGSYQDRDGITILRALKDAGLSKRVRQTSLFDPLEVKAFLELHIEQYDSLARSARPIGIIKNIAAPTRFLISIEGRAVHSGAAPMKGRLDALAAAAEIILCIEKCGREESIYDTVATVTTIEITPGNMNVVPGSATLGVDIRGIDSRSKARVVEALEYKCREISRERNGITIRPVTLETENPVALDQDLILLAEEICSQMGVPYTLMNSPAGHDCMAMAKVVPAGMIFVSNASGISHNPDEWVEPGAISTGLAVLYEMIKKLAHNWSSQIIG